MDNITTTEAPEEESVFTGFIDMLKKLFKIILPIIGLEYFVKYLD